MNALEKVRSQYPDYKDVDDATLADALYKKFYSDMPRADYDAKLGLSLQPSAASAGFATREQRGEDQITQGEAFRTGLSQGATFGMYDEAAALTAAGEPKFAEAGQPMTEAERQAADLFGNSPAISPLEKFGAGVRDVAIRGTQPAQETYDRALAQERGAIRAAEQQYPWTALAGNVVGGVAVPLPAAQGVKSMAALGAGTGALYGFGTGEGTENRIGQAATGAAIGGALGAGVGYVANKLGGAPPPAPLPSPSSVAAREMDIPLSQGQRTGDIATLSTENAIAGGARGDAAQRVAAEFRANQDAAIRAARDRIANLAGDGVQLERAGDAGLMVGQRLAETADEAAARIARAQADDAARIAANEAAARGTVARGAETISSRINPEGQTPITAADDLIEGMRGKAAAAKSGYQSAYDKAFNEYDGVIAPEFFTGLAKGGKEIAVPGSPLNEFAAPLSERIKSSLINRPEPIIPDPAITPLAAKTLDQLDRISSMNIGKIGAPAAGQDVAGVNLRGLEQARKIVISNIKNAANNPSDQRALRGIVSELDGQIESVMQSALFKGDEGALDAIRQARSAFSAYQRTFKPQGQGDDAGNAIRKIIERDATPEEVSNFIFGASRLGDSGLSVRLYDRVSSIFGKSSDEMKAIKGAAWHKLTGGDVPTDPKSAKAVADRITEALTGRGSTLTSKMFEEGERKALGAYAGMLRTFAAREAEQVKDVAVPSRLKVIMDVAAKRMSPEETVAAMLGTGNKVNGKSLQLVDAVGDIVGRNSPEWGAIRQAAWMRLTKAAEGQTQPGPQAMSQKIFWFTNGDGQTLAKRLFSSDEIAEMNKFAEVLKSTVPPPGATNPPNSGNRIMALIRNFGASIAAAAGATAGGPLGAGAGYVFGQGMMKFADMRNAQAARKLFSGVEQQAGPRLGARLGEALGKIPGGGVATQRLIGQAGASVGEAFPAPVVQMLSGPLRSAADQSNSQTKPEEQNSPR